jgi:hypothetical protein
VVVVVLDPGRDPGPGRRLGRVVLDAPQLELQGGVPRLDDRVIQRRPGPAHGLGDGKPLAGSPEVGRGVLLRLPWSVCMMTPGTAPPRTATAITSAP